MDAAIILQLTPEEGRWLAGFIDLGLKSQGSAVLPQAAALQGKLEAAAKKAASEETKPA